MDGHVAQGERAVLGQAGEIMEDGEAVAVGLQGENGAGKVEAALQLAVERIARGDEGQARGAANVVGLKII